jgi:hypothetical protein
VLHPDLAVIAQINVDHAAVHPPLAVPASIEQHIVAALVVEKILQGD